MKNKYTIRGIKYEKEASKKFRKLKKEITIFSEKIESEIDKNYIEARIDGEEF